MVWFFLILSVVLGAVAQVLMKEAMRTVGEFPGVDDIGVAMRFFMGAVFSWQMLTALACYGVSFFMWLGVLSREDLSFARPFVSLGYVIVILYGFYAGERMTTERLFGIALVMVGLFFIARSSQG